MNRFPTISHNEFISMYEVDGKLDGEHFENLFFEMDCAIFDFMAKMWENVEM